MRILCLSFVVLALATISNAQEDSLDIWIDQIESNIRDQFLADSLARDLVSRSGRDQNEKAVIIGTSMIAEVFRFHQQYDSSIFYSKRQFEMAKEVGDTNEMAFSYSVLGSLYRVIGELDSAFWFLDNCSHWYQTLKDTGNVAHTYMRTGKIFSYHTNEPEKAIRYFLQAKRSFEALADTLNLGRVNREIGWVYNSQEDLENTRSYLDAALSAFGAIRDTFEILTVLNSFGILCRKEKNHQSAEQYYMDMLQLGTLANMHQLDYLAHANLGRLKQESGAFQQGLDFTRKAIAAWDPNDAAGLAGLHGLLAENLFGLDQYNQALTMAHKSLDLAQQANALSRQRDATLTLSSIYKSMGNDQQAYHFLRAHKVVYDSLFNTEKTEIIHGLETKYETEKKEAAIKLMQKSAEVDAVQKRSLRMGLILLGLTGWFIIYALLLNKRKNDKIHQQKMEMAGQKQLNLELELAHKKKELIARATQLARKNEFLHQLEEQVATLGTHVDQHIRKATDRINRLISYDRLEEEEWQQFSEEFRTVHKEFLERLHDKYGSFTHSEMRLITLLKMNLSSKEIANILRISDQSIWKSRYRLRKKMKLDKDIDLQGLLLAL